MAIAKLILNGVVQMDLTQDTVTASTLIGPETAHNAAGEAIIGTATSGTPVFSVDENGYIFLDNQEGYQIDLSGAIVPISQNTIGGLFKAIRDGSFDTLEISVTSGTNPIEIDFEGPIKGYIAYPKSITVLDGLAKDEHTAFAMAIFNDPDENDAQTPIYAFSSIKTVSANRDNLFSRISSYTFVDGVLSLVPTYPTNANYHPFGFENTYIFVYWWEGSS